MCAALSNASTFLMKCSDKKLGHGCVEDQETKILKICKHNCYNQHSFASAWSIQDAAHSCLGHSLGFYELSTYYWLLDDIPQICITFRIDKVSHMAGMKKFIMLIPFMLLCSCRFLLLRQREAAGVSRLRCSSRLFRHQSPGDVGQCHKKGRSFFLILSTPLNTLDQPLISAVTLEN